jgi:hypothetical protein
MSRAPLAAALALALATLSGCGGSNEMALIPAAHAQPAPQPVVYDLHAILRPDSTGRWYVQRDIDHAPVGISWEVEQTDQFVRLHFFRSYTHAGVVHVTSDDDFAGRVKGYSNLGLASATVRIEVDGRRINPRHILQYVPGADQAGNLWITVRMVDVR